jgi:hypothetical protein
LLSIKASKAAHANATPPADSLAMKRASAERGGALGWLGVVN